MRIRIVELATLNNVAALPSLQTALFLYIFSFLTHVEPWTPSPYKRYLTTVSRHFDFLAMHTIL